MIALIKARYWIFTPDGPKKVRGVSAGGDWGVHKSGRLWCVDHLPTGLRAAVGIKQHAEKLAVILTMSIERSKPGTKPAVPECLLEWLGRCQRADGILFEDHLWTRFLLWRAYEELSVAQFERIEDNDGAAPSCVCDPGDPCPAHRTDAVLTDIYELLR